MVNSMAMGVSIEYDGKAKFSGDVLLQFPGAVCVTEDGTILVVDLKANDIKMYRQNGDFVKLLCRQGYGPNEIAEPNYCSYSNHRFVVNDNGQRKIYIYKRKGPFAFTRIEEIYTLDGAWDHCLTGDRLYISGNKNNNEHEPFALYSIEIGEKTEAPGFFLPARMKFGLKSIDEFKKKYYSGIEIAAIGYKARFDIAGDCAYFAWECDLKIFKINLKSKEISTFGKKMTHYVKPYLSNRLKNAWKAMQGKLVMEERRKMSYIWEIFATGKHVAVIYNLPSMNNGKTKYKIQFYRQNGEFVNELPIPGNPGPPMFFEKKNSRLYAINREDVDVNIDENFYILNYKIGD
jgi:hypothetical protein